MSPDSQPSTLTVTDSRPSLAPLSYHAALADFLRREEAETWTWFDSSRAQADHAESLRLDLLKNTYRLEPEAHSGLYEVLATALERLGLTSTPATLYQAQADRMPNAALFFLPCEIHIVFEGGLLDLLDPRETASVLGHELAHFRLWSDHAHLLTDRVVNAMANDRRAEPAHIESARLLRLYTEIYADRGALEVAGDPAVVISGLVKISTGLRQVDPAGYVRQAGEIFARSETVRTDGLSHPEAFIRARAITLWADGAPDTDTEITRMIEGATSLDRLDLVGQHRLAEQTRRWLHLLTRPSWFQTDSVRGHARLFFDDFAFAPAAHDDESLLGELRAAGHDVRDYFCYTLLDFAVADPELDEAPLKEAFRLVDRVDWADRLETLAAKELKLKRREVQKIRADAEAERDDASATGDIADPAP